MSRSDLELRLVRWLDDGPHAAPKDIIEAALREAGQERQLRVIALPWPKSRRLALPASWAQTAVSVAAVVFAAVILIWGFNNAPALPPASQSPSPTGSPTILPSQNVTESSSPNPSPSAGQTDTAVPSASSVPTASSTASASPSSTASAVPSATVTATPTPTVVPTPTGSAPPGGWNQPLLSAAGEFDDLAATFDPLTGGLHIAAAIAVGSGDSRGIVYSNGRVLNGGERVTIAPSGQDNLGYDGEPDIAVEADGTVWIAFTRYECAGCTPTVSSGVFVTNNAGGSWTEPVQIAGAQAFDPSIVVSNGIAHVTYAWGQMPEQPAYPSYYATNETGVWTTVELAPNASLPQLIFDAEGIPSAVFSTPSGIGWTSFVSLDAQTTQDVPGPTGAVDGLLITADEAGLAHVLYFDSSGGWNDVAQRPGGGWNTAVPVKTGRVQLDAIRVAPGSVEIVGSGRGMDVPGAALVYGSDGRTVPIVSGEVTRTDLTGDTNFYAFVYAYAGTEAQHGIWFTGHNGGL